MPATRRHLDDVVSWIKTAGDCQRWAGPSVSFPIDRNRLPETIRFGEIASYALTVEGGDTGGFGQIIPKSNGRQHLARIIVNPEMRGRGLGRQLCTALLATVGRSPASLYVYRSNQAALRLYRSLGFLEDPERTVGDLIYLVKRGLTA